MKQPTLDEFIAVYGKGVYTQNLYVKEPGFTALYVRMSRRFIDGIWCDPTLDLASLEVRYPGKGTFTRLVERLRKHYPDMTLYVESVLNNRFQRKLVELKFIPIGQDCFVLYAQSKR